MSKKPSNRKSKAAGESDQLESGAYFKKTNELSARIREGDALALTEFKSVAPELSAKLLEEYGDLAGKCENTLIRAYTGKNLFYHQGIKDRVRNMREDLEGPNPNPLESILIERIVCCWIQAHHADILSATRQNPTIQQGDYFQRRQDQATRRFLQACKALAQVRKLLGPNIQVNVAEKQINIMQKSDANTKGR